MCFTWPGNIGPAKKDKAGDFGDTKQGVLRKPSKTINPDERMCLLIQAANGPK